jgi:four helix bundle protein
MAFMFENLAVYQRAMDLAEQIATLTETFPRGYYFLTDQLNRAALSIATNLAEGNGRFTKADRKNFFVVARASAQECVPLVDLAFRKRFLSESARLEVRERMEVIAKMISGLISGMDKRQA